MKPHTKLDRNQINPDKLLLSKWTAVTPQNKEKHFMVNDIIRDEQNVIVACSLEAILTGRTVEIDWRVLENKTEWLAGWH